MKRLIIGISGASGAIYGVRMLQVLQPLAEVETHLVMSPAARQTNACLLTPVVEDTDVMTWSSTNHSSPVVATMSGRDAFERFQVTPPSEAVQRANMHALVPLNDPTMRAGFVSGMYRMDEVCVSLSLTSTG